MYPQFEANERHFIRIKEIIDCRYMDKPTIKIKGKGIIYARDRGYNSGIKKEEYNITIYAYNALVEYIINELSIGDHIFIIGHTGVRGTTNGYFVRVTIAEQIYKSEWHSYCNTGNNLGGWNDFNN